MNKLSAQLGSTPSIASFYFVFQFAQFLSKRIVIKSIASRIVLISFVILILILNTISPVFADPYRSPAARAPFDLRNSSQTDLFSGSAYYTYSIKVPKGTDDLTPEVSLSYNSSAAYSPSAYAGMGWDVSRDYVERDANFTPSSTTDDKFKLFFRGVAYDLVYVASDGRYHTKIESNLHITKVTSGSSNESGEYWQVITTDGTKYRFGQASNSELICSGRSYVYRWNLDLVTDLHSNNIYYTYSESSGASFLTKIEYNTEKARVIDFTYATNPYQHPVYVQGCSVTETQRLSDIKVKANSSLVHQFDLGYVTASNSGQLLQSITEKGTDGSSLPSTTFSYKPEAKSISTQSTTWLDHADVDVHLEKTDVTLADVNGDGLVDIVRTTASGGSNSWKVLINQGNSWSTTFQTWVNNAPMDSDLERTDTRLIDVTGDNLPDIVKTHGNGTKWTIYRNTGSSWNTTAETWADNSNFPNPADPKVGMEDVNGDGLVDLIRTSNGSGTSTWEIFMNTGSSWNNSIRWWDNVNQDARLDEPFVRLVDANGDGLPDIIKTSYSGSNVSWYVYKNTGSAWTTSPETWINNANVDAHFQQDSVALSDVNGDGLPDIIKTVAHDGYDTWKVLLNQGNSWSTTYETWMDDLNVDADLPNDYVEFMDVTGDGLTDIVKGVADCSCSYDTWKVWKNNGLSSHLLSTVRTSQGGAISFDYKPSTIYDNTGADSLSDLPFSLWLVEKKTENNGMTNTQQTNHITTYSYKDGLYDWQDREFRGFGTVDENLPNTSKKKYVFKQDDILKGRLDEVQTRDSQDNPFFETENSWGSTSANGVSTVTLDTEKNYTYDGSASNPKINQTNYLYDTYGNVTKVSELGDTGVTGDERFTYSEYTANTTAWIVDTLKHTYRNAANDSTKVAEKWFYYDGNAGLSDSPTKGDLTKEVKWLSGGTNPETTYAYDSYGNVTQVTDANNHSTTYTYNITDSTRTYAERETNAKNQQTNFSYDLGTGNLLSKTDPNGLQTSYNYDVFGRITKEIKPYDNTTYPSINYTYLTDGIAPEGTLVSKREVSGVAGTLDSYTWVDGFDRKIQTRTDAEDTSKQIITDTFYDPTGEILKQTVPYLATLGTSYADPASGTKATEMTYDALGRTTVVKNPKNDSRTTAYDHWKLTDIDEEGNIKRKYLSAYEKIIKIEEVDGGLSYATEYAYNALDELTQIFDAASNTFSFVYDTLGRKTSQTDPDMGTWNYTYDAVGNLINKTDARNITTIHSYDELNRIVGINYPNDTDTAYTYDGNSKIGTLTSVTDAVGTVNYTYDNRLRKTQEQRTVSGTTKTTQFAYDAADRMTTQTNPDSTTAAYAHNAQGEIESLTDIVDNFDYNALGKITKKDFDNGVTTNYTYNTDDFRLNRIQTGSFFDKNYTYDKVGNIASITNNLNSKVESFSYDDLDRLKTATETNGYNYSFDYNAIGNLTKFTDNATALDYAYGANAGVHALTGLAITESTPAPATNYSAEYFNNNNLSGTPALTRTDASINFDWGGGSPDGSIQTDNFSARWTKTINFEAGNYIFSTTTDDGVKLYIDNQLVIDKWIGQSSVTHTAVQTLSAGNHDIKMEYYEGGGGAVARFNYQKLTQDFTGEYFSNKTLSGTPTMVRNDKDINFNWDTAAPSVSIPMDNFSTRWTKVASFSAGMYQFTVRADDGVRLFVDDQQIINGWVDQSATTYTTTKAMSGGSHRIRVEYYDSGWGANAQFVYSQVSGPFAAEYFNNQTLSGTPALTRDEAAVDFNWGDGSPDASIQTNQFSARFTKTQNFAAGDYEFSITGDDGIRLFIDGTQVINGWVDQGSVGYTTTQTLSAGNHTIKVEYYEAWGGATAKLSINKTDTNLALNHTVASSSAENNDPNLLGVKAVDGSTTTRWSSNASDPQWIYADLGSRKTINRVKLNWHTAYGSEYQIQVSDNATSWTTVRWIGGANGGIDDVTGFYGTGRYVRMYGTQRGTGGSYSLYEFEVYGDVAPSLPTPSGSFFYLYDANGNMTSDALKCYEYNEANQLKKVKRCADNQTIVEYVYDFNGKRIIKKNYSNGNLSNTVISWTESFETKVIVGGATDTTVYYFANKELVAKKNPDGGKIYYHNDHLGSSSILTNQAGSQVESTTYDPWGKLKSGGTQSKFLYTGQEHDSETGLDYYNARYYSSDIRRFTQPDDIIQNVYDPQSLNRYSYVNNNPLRYTDPTGHCWGPIGSKVCGFLQPYVQSVAKAVTNFVSKVVSKPASQQVTVKAEQAVTSGGGKSSSFTPPSAQIQQISNTQIPKVTDPKLQNLINNNLYKGANNPKRIGSGSTADAIQNEAFTGKQTFGKWHEIQGKENINALNNWLKTHSNASEEDIKVANTIKDDIMNALQEINKVK